VYNPDPWSSSEWVVAASGVGCAAALIATSLAGVDGLQVVVSPLTWPQLPVTAALGILVGLIPAWAAPPAEEAPGEGAAEGGTA
jgi:energy-coupling factor transport system permease protein